MLISHKQTHVLQGLLSAMAAKVRAKQRQLASTAPSLLQFTSTRTQLDKALKDAETAAEAALQVIEGLPQHRAHKQMQRALDDKHDSRLTTCNC